MGLLARFTAQRDIPAVIRLGLTSAVAAVPGVLYMAWRIRYFGYFFPNTFYIKLDRGTAWINSTGMVYAASFVAEVLLPYLLLAGLLLVTGLRGRGRVPLLVEVGRISPILFGALLHGFYLLTLTPIQGFFWRYALPIFPALLYAMARIFARLPAEMKARRAPLLWLAAAFFVAWNLRFLPEASYHEEYRTQYDRVAIGRALAGVEGTLFTSAAGAIPYFSNWKAVDALGLVSEEIAHHGVSVEFLRALDPDLIVLRSPHPTKLVFRQQNRKKTEQYMLRRGYLVVGAVYRSGGYLVLFVRRDSPLRDELARRLTTMEDVIYGDLAILMRESEIPTFSRPIGSP